MKFLFSILIAAAVTLGGIGAYHNFIAPQNDGLVVLGGFNPAAGGTYRLQSSIGTTNTSITLSSFKEPISETNITMSTLGSDIGYGTLDPQSSTRKEFISFTGITQNANGTATLTGVTRGLGFQYPYAASATYRKAHPGQSIFILSDSPQLFDEYTKRRSNEWITGTWGFSSNATSTSNCSSAEEYCRKDYVDNVVNQGAATSTESVSGIVELATAAEQAAGTANTANLAYALTAEHATSTPGANNVAANHTIIADSNGFLGIGWISSALEYAFGSLTATNATTTNLTISGTVSSLLKTDASGIVSGAVAGTDYPPVNLTFSTTTDALVNNGSIDTTTFLIPAGTIHASSTIRTLFSITGVDVGADTECSFALKTSGDVTLGGIGLGTMDGTNTYIANGEFMTLFNSSVSSQTTLGYSNSGKNSITNATRAGASSFSENTSSIDFSSAVTLKGVLTSGGGGANCTINNMMLKVN